ncbi:hypothetical protein [Hymenobacter sp. BT491]|uniref:hypothetical protein n=1 Tax=Hymenobacter sp. BT491 TaxID=2766779 RepID=UPI001653B450|nr:hypothetical protein [Hymenobacter sp. BT491]MBC6988992.1 hypothetical protein [Hymenobacter sp. BT491]
MKKRLRKKMGKGEFTYTPHYTPEQLAANAQARELLMQSIATLGADEFVRRLKALK